MAFNNIEVTQIKNCIELVMGNRRPAPPIRNEIDLQYRIWANDVYIVELRFIDGRRIDSSKAKATFDRMTKVWSVYYKGSSNDWVKFNTKNLSSFESAIKIIESDSTGCFFG